MTLEKLELDKLMQQYSISEFRNIPEYVKICEAFTVGLNSIQDAVDYLSDMINVDKAQGIWLDYIGWLVGTSRQYMSLTNYFCVNRDDVNKSIYFWFKGTSTSAQESLDDALFRKRIYGKIGYNISKGTREENIYIIKNITAADYVEITQEAPMLLNITLYGDNIIQTMTLQQDIENIFPNGIGINNLVVKGLDEYEY